MQGSKRISRNDPYLQVANIERPRHRHRKVLRSRRGQRRSLLGQEAVEALDPNHRVSGAKHLQPLPLEPQLHYPTGAMLTAGKTVADRCRGRGGGDEEQQ